MQIATFSEWLVAVLGTRRWVVAQRLTPRLRERQYEIAISEKRFNEYRAQYAAACRAAAVRLLKLAEAV